jgi:AraC-like DNA-binding protein
MTPTLLPRDVRKALALLNANPVRERTLGELAAACRVAPRTLQKHFRRFVGRSPIAVLRDLRLDLVRRELLRGRPEISISELATQSGFGHLGRFAGWYRQRYGESPLTTLRRGRSDREPTKVGARAVPPAIDRPIVAVLPFRIAAALPSLGAGLDEEIAIALRRRRSVAVGTPYTARYRVRGNVRTTDAGELRITVALFDAASGRWLWADAWEGAREDALAFEARVADGIATKLQNALRDAELARARRREPEERTAWALTMRSLSRAVLLEPAAVAEALELAEQAIELAPRDPLPLALAAWCHGARAGHHFTAHPRADRAAAIALTERAAQLPARDATTEALLAAACTFAHEMPQARLHIDRALALDGGCAWAWQRSGWLKVYAGDAAEAIERFQIARRLDPADPLGFLTAVGIAAANFERATYPEAIRWFRRGIAESPTAAWSNRFLAPACALAGRKDEAQASLAALTRVYPDWTITQVRSALPHTPGYVDRAADGLESLGMRL